MKITGCVVSGTHRGKRFVAMPFYSLQFKQKLGFVPFPGTLNLRVGAKARKKIAATKGIRIAGKRGRGGAWCFAVKINGVHCFVIILDKSTHPKNIVEVLSRHNLRKKLKLINERRVRITAMEWLQRHGN